MAVEEGAAEDRQNYARVESRHAALGLEEGAEGDIAKASGRRGPLASKACSMTRAEAGRSILVRSKRKPTKRTQKRGEAKATLKLKVKGPLPKVLKAARKIIGQKATTGDE
jgi:hypothetical protein